MTEQHVQLFDLVETIVLQDDPLYVVQVFVDGGPSFVRWPDGRLTKMGTNNNSPEDFDHLTEAQFVRLLAGMDEITTRWLAAFEELAKHDGPDDLLPDYLR